MSGGGGCKPALEGRSPSAQEFRRSDSAPTALGGGSDGLHKLVLVFTNFFEAMAGRLKVQ